MKGWVIPTGQSRVIASRGLNFLYKISQCRKWTFGTGYWEIRFFILIKAAATIRNFTVVQLWRILIQDFRMVMSSIILPHQLNHLQIKGKHRNILGFEVKRVNTEKNFKLFCQ